MSRILPITVAFLVAYTVVPVLQGCSGMLSFAEQENTNNAANTSKESLLNRWRTEYISYKRKGQFRVGVLPSTQTPDAQIVYFPGFADRFENHPHLLGQLSGLGFNVISYDFPSHGESKLENQGLNGFSISDLAEMGVATLEKLGSPKLPTYFLGWSTGGLVAVRLVQQGLLPEGWNLRGAALLAPALAPRLIVGELGFVTKETLSRDPNPPYIGPIEPKTPMAFPLFAASLIRESNLSRSQSWPKQIPLLVIAAGSESDRYVSSLNVLEWGSSNRRSGVDVFLASCPNARHDLENEPFDVGTWVRVAVLEFVQGRALEASSAVCQITKE